MSHDIEDLREFNDAEPGRLPIMVECQLAELRELKRARCFAQPQGNAPEPRPLDAMTAPELLSELHRIGERLAQFSRSPARVNDLLRKIGALLPGSRSFAQATPQGNALALLRGKIALEREARAAERAERLERSRAVAANISAGR